ncbi:AsmA family protein [Aeromonas hydrophila]|uniref:AsmA family protein n=2 Tax=Aeromonas hydrophila TaxID=644 RepID=A0AAX3P216_AERHY|nr:MULTISPECIES: AsmA family protein [Aeromonas]HDT5864363.1 AsmA family protein [Aeromonas hydrophila subsp. hydrophila]MCO4116657.1 AsmA family protein [Aeromonas hydrophila]MCV9384404.1 AsmA family protein [Aeromonas hydrophila]MDD9225431.1 AsmA family protein [Aeromonas hydrophila]WEA29441.1 AsmA family protein [Aeromonas hydrophila]
MKKIIYILLGLALAAVVAIAALVSLIDPNQFKPQLVEQVRKSTGRELVMEGAIGWRFWPSLGLSLEQVALRNPAGFAEPDLVRFTRGEASVGLLPLLSHKLEIGKVTLSGAHLFIQTKADGSSNLSDLLKASAEPKGEATTSEPAATTPPPASDKQPWQISLQGVALQQASALLQDDRSGTVSRLEQLDLNLGQLAVDQWVPVTLAAKGAQGELAFDLKGSAQLKLAPDASRSELKDVALAGSLSEPTQRLDAFSLKADRLALGQWSSLTLSLQGAQGAADKPTLAGTLEGTLKARLDENRQLLEISDAVLAAKLSGDALPRPQMQVKLAGFARAELGKQAVTLSNLVMGVDDALLSGNGSVQLGAVPKVEFDLKGEKLDLDSWLGQPAKAAPATATSGAAAPAGAQAQTAAPAAKALSTAEPDLTALKAVDLAGRLQLGSLRLKGLDLSAVDLQLALAGGQLTLKQFSAGVAGGQVTASGVLDARQLPARYQVHKRVQGVDVRPLLQTLAQTDLLEGKGDLEVEAQGSGLSEQALRSRMQGKVSLRLSDGALHGINLAEMIREARATLTGKGADQVKEVRKTDFSALTASFRIADGVARSDDIQLFAPALRVKGQGQTALVPETLDFLFLTSVVESSKGQGGKTVDELKDITIPVRIGGHWQAPSYRLDVKELLSNNKLLEDKARKEAERGLKKLLGDKADNEGVKGVADQLLKGLFK